MNMMTLNELSAWAQAKEAQSRCSIAPLLIKLYRFKALRRQCRIWARRLEGGEYFSQTLRDFQRIYHGVTIGEFSYSGCLRPGVLPRGAIVGRYTGISHGLAIYQDSHPFDWLSPHPMFYHPRVGPHDKDTRSKVREEPLRIGNDVYIGDYTILLPRCRNIGDGAVIGAGSVVTKDVPPFAIVAGNPARFLRWRFPEPVIKMIQDSRWWERPLHEVVQCLPEMMRTIDDNPIWHPLLNPSMNRLTASKISSLAAVSD